MKYLTGVLVIAACLAPYCTWADNDAAAAGAATAVAAAAISTTSVDNGSAAKAAAAAASSTAVGPLRAHVPCNCNKIYDPVCGSDGRTYSNRCVLRCISDNNILNGLPGIRVISYGECRRYPCHCNNVFRPLCASDGNTYANECYFRCENARRFALGLNPLRIINYGVCKRNFCQCPDTIIPICGTDGRTYRNICILQCVSRIEQSQGRPPIYWASSEPCRRERCICPTFSNPLCGTDGKTYRDRCMLACENRKRDQLGLLAITIQYRGNCADCQCSVVYQPVCASNGVTFRNVCVLSCTNIIRAQLNLPPLTITSTGVCPCFCPLYVDPICGTDEKTYSNRCFLKCERKRRLDLGLRPISVAYKGRCLCNCSYCDRSYAPLCGNDGRTYWNRCWLNCNKHCFSDLARPLYAVHPGPC